MPVESNLQLSIILPIYNVEPYVEKCIRSLESQDIPKNSYEIICVNDGSPDNSQRVVENLQQEFSNIILINQENQGVSKARNIGIKHANGKYILFVDPDDSLQQNCLASLLNYAAKHQYKVVYFGMTIIDINGRTKEIKYKNSYEKLMDGITLYYAVRGRKATDPDRSWAILFERELLIENNLFYVPDVPYLEDGEFIARVLCLTKKGSIYNHPYYQRLNRPGSATRSNLFTRKKTINGFILAAKNLENFKETHSLSSKQIGLINGRIVKFVVLAVNSTSKNFKNFNWIKKELKRNGFLKLDLIGIDPYYKKMGKKYNKSINYLYISSMIENMYKSFNFKLKALGFK